MHRKKRKRSLLKSNEEKTTNHDEKASLRKAQKNPVAETQAFLKQAVNLQVQQSFLFFLGG
uniref:Uncharacterized protein n=1 Tax=Rhizophora mucronata TaxID=61149 RepID=A0A2P2NT06_RHIMU